MFNQVKVPEQKPQTGLPVIEEMQSRETEDKTLIEDPLGPNGQLYDGYFKPEKYEPCAKSLRREEKKAKDVQEQEEFEKKWNEVPPSPLSKETKDTAQPGKENLSDPIVLTPSVLANRKWLYDLLHQKNLPMIIPRNSRSRMNSENISNSLCKSQSNVRGPTRKTPLELTVAQNTISWKNSDNPIHLLVWTSFSIGLMTSSQKRSHQTLSNGLETSTIIGFYLRFEVYVLRQPMSRLKPGSQTERI